MKENHNSIIRYKQQMKWICGASLILTPACIAHPSDKGNPVELPVNKDHPNFVIILADDMGYSDVGAFGSKDIHTPNIDKMVSEGMKFTDFHSNGAVSSPTRCALLTGRYQQRAGVENVLLVNDALDKIKGGLPTNEITFADILRKNGYSTALIGKWHLGYKEENNPLNFGFEKYIGFKSGNVDYHSHLNRRGDLDWWDGLELKNMPGYTTSLLTDLSCDYIVENKDRPFCLYIAHAAPHSPLQGPSDGPVREDASNAEKSSGRSNFDIYREMVEELDAGVGKVLRTLDKYGLTKNTLVIFTSDNGPVIEYGGSAGQFKGEKGTVWEGGHRVPCVIRMPETIKPGRVCDIPLMSFDLFPTILEMAGVNYDDAGKKLDGVSFVNVLRDGNIKERILFWGIGNDRYAVRQGNWKMVCSGKEKSLYNLESDPEESVDVSSKNPAIVQNLSQQLEVWKKSVY